MSPSVDWTEGLRALICWLYLYYCQTPAARPYSTTDLPPSLIHPLFASSIPTACLLRLIRGRGGEGRGQGRESREAARERERPRGEAARARRHRTADGETYDADKAKSTSMEPSPMAVRVGGPPTRPTRSRRRSCVCPASPSTFASLYPRPPPTLLLPPSISISPVWTPTPMPSAWTPSPTKPSTWFAHLYSISISIPLILLLSCLFSKLKFNLILLLLMMAMMTAKAIRHSSPFNLLSKAQIYFGCDDDC